MTRAIVFSALFLILVADAYAGDKEYQWQVERTIPMQEEGWKENTFYRSPLIFSPDDKLLLAYNIDGQMCVWDVPTGKRRNYLPKDDRLRDLIFTPDSSLIVAAVRDGIKVFDASTLASLMHFRCNWPSTPQISADGKTLLAWTDNPLEVLVWSMDSGKLLWKFSTRTWIDCAQFVDNSRVVISYSDEERPKDGEPWHGMIGICNAQTGKRELSFAESLGQRNILNVSPDGLRMLTCRDGSHGVTVDLRDTATGNVRATLENVSKWPQQDFTWSQDSGHVMTQSGAIWDVKTGKIVEKLDGKTQSKIFTSMEGLSPRFCYHAESSMLRMALQNIRPKADSLDAPKLFIRDLVHAQEIASVPCKYIYTDAVVVSPGHKYAAVLDGNKIILLVKRNR